MRHLITGNKYQVIVQNEAVECFYQRKGTFQGIPVYFFVDAADDMEFYLTPLEVTRPEIITPLN